MKKYINIILLLISFFSSSAFEITSPTCPLDSSHKFYVSIYQINYNQKDKRLEITSRIFIDDLNAALKLKYNKKTYLATKEESKEDIDLMKKYISDNFTIRINGISKTINYLSNENQANVFICYFNIKDISRIKTLEIKNTSLFDLNSEQQNIIQTTMYGKKESLLLTTNNEKGLIKVE